MVGRDQADTIVFRAGHAARRSFADCDEYARTFKAFQTGGETDRGTARKLDVFGRHGVRQKTISDMPAALDRLYAQTLTVFGHGAPGDEEALLGELAGEGDVA
jgi:hypothetical protein